MPMKHARFAAAAVLAVAPTFARQLPVIEPVEAATQVRAFSMTKPPSR
jgi:hypothetical protein